MSKDIKKIAEKCKQENGNDKITNKELLWYMISEFDDLKTRVTRTETKQKMIIIFIPIIVTIIAVLI